MSNSRLYGPFLQLISLEDIKSHGAISDDEINIIQHAGILVEDGIIKEISEYSSLIEKYDRVIRVSPHQQNWIALPTFIDCHTHICWAGTRANDYAARVAGKSYLEIAASGGGIMTTVNAARMASEEELVEGILARVEQHLKRGISTIEVKSGYGLTVEDELKMLRAIQSANQQTVAELVPTFLGAHIKPKDFDGPSTDYLKMMIEQVVPVIKEEGLASRADIFVEEGAFTLNEAYWYAEDLMKLGYDVTMHVDQFHSGGSKLAIGLGCVSADHLEFTDEAGISAFSNSETVAVALPGASLGLGMQFTPARKLLDAGASLAIASDWNPGSAPMGDLVTQASILGAAQKLTIAETLAGITTRAAGALRLNRGTIVEGESASFNIFETDDFRNIFYQQGQLRPVASIIGKTYLSHD